MLTCKLRVGAVLMVLAISVLTSGRVQNDYRTYHNARFDYRISYPAILVAQGEAENGDGQKFLSSDSRAEMLVYGVHNSLNQSLRQLYESESSTKVHADRRITYQVIKRDWFVVSGIEGGRIFYQKTLFRNGVFKTFRIEYDEAAKQIFNPITTRIALSFKG